MLAITLASSSRASGFAPVEAANSVPDPFVLLACPAVPFVPAAPPPRTLLRLFGGACPRRMSFRCSAALSSPVSSAARLLPKDVEAPLLFPASPGTGPDCGRRTPLLKPGVRRRDV